MAAKVYFFIALILIAGCGKKSRLTEDTFQLVVNPSASNITPGSSIEISVSARSAVNSDIALNVNWVLQTSDKGSLSVSYGPKTVFSASNTAYGTAVILAVYNDFIQTVEVGIGVKDILNDLHSAGFFGVFSSTGIPGTSFAVLDDRGNFMEGSKSIRADFTIPVAGYGGFYIQAGAESTSVETADMSAYAGGNLRFWIKTPVDLEIQIKDTSVRSKQLSGISGIYLDNSWHEVVLPISGFGLTDISKIRNYFAITAISDNTYNGANPISGSFFVDNVRWTIN